MKGLFGDQETYDCMLTRNRPKNPHTVTLTDLETGGLNQRVHYPIQLAAIKLVHSDDPYELQVDCTLEYKLKLPDGYTVPAEAARLNGYSDEVWAKSAVDRIGAYKEYLGKLAWSCFGGQNPAFDHKFLDEDFLRLGLEWPRLSYYGLVSVDTMARQLRLQGYIENLKQETLCRLFKLGGQTHDALDDILQCAEIYRRLLWLECLGFTDTNIQTAVDMPSELYTKK